MNSDPAQKPSQPAEEGGEPQTANEELMALPGDSLQVRAEKMLKRLAFSKDFQELLKKK